MLLCTKILLQEWQNMYANTPNEMKIYIHQVNKDKLDVTNYRPISILPVISKVYEKVFYNRLYNYFSVNNLLSSSQFGFRSGASTEHALLKFSDDLLKLFDQKKVAIATFMDLRKSLTVQIIIFYYLNSIDMASMKLHCNR